MFKNSFDLTLADLERCPFWVWCEMEDENQSWYDQIESTTFREYAGQFPIHDESGICKMIAKLKNGIHCDALSFFNGKTLDSPELFINNDRIGFTFKNIDGTDSDVKNAMATLTNGFGGTIEELLPIEIVSVDELFQKPIKLCVRCFKSIATFDGSLEIRHWPETKG